jgi:predicted nucleic acid-binding Zn ribbon protein
MRGEVLFMFLLIAALVVILVALYLRYRNLQMFHQERLAALEKGTQIPIGHTLSPWSPRVYLLRGLLWSFAGVALIVSLLGIAASTHQPESAETTLWRAQNLAHSLNISAEEAKQIAEKDRDARRNGMPFSVCLLGLIPVGVGLAYLVFYYTGERRSTGEA